VLPHAAAFIALNLCGARQSLRLFQDLSGAIVKHCDPDVTPNPKEWLELDEQERIQLAERYHLRQRIDLPSVKAHAAFHAIVENQIAEGLEPVVRAMMRLTGEGLSRHDSLHAIGSVLADHFYATMNSKDADFANSVQAHYYAAVERLTAKEWHRKYEEPDA